jgi:hypothetical protein
MVKAQVIERRVLAGAAASLEARAAVSGVSGQLTGYAAVYDKWATVGDIGGNLWEERIAPGTFAASLRVDDVRALFNHDENIVLGRKSAGTLTLREDAQGLRVNIAPPNSEWGRSVFEAVKRGDVSGMSIAFVVTRDQWQRGGSVRMGQRTIQEARLIDVSPVTFPAYPQTSIAAVGSLSSAEPDKYDAASRNRRLEDILKDQKRLEEELMRSERLAKIRADLERDGSDNVHSVAYWRKQLDQMEMDLMRSQLAAMERQHGARK